MEKDSGDSEFCLWDLNSNSKVICESGSIDAAKFSDDGKSIIVGKNKKQI